MADCQNWIYHREQLKLIHGIMHITFVVLINLLVATFVIIFLFLLIVLSSMELRGIRTKYHNNGFVIINDREWLFNELKWLQCESSILYLRFLSL